ncbi:MAG: hypothetical protein AAB443_01625 [Patescibacteria group bacterium]
MIKFLENLTWPFRKYWDFWKVMTPFPYANAGVTTVTFLVVFTLFRGLVYYPVTQDPTMPIGMGRSTWIELLFLPGGTSFLFSLVTLIVLVPLFVWNYYRLLHPAETGRKKKGPVKDTLPLTNLRMVWICLTGIILLGWTIH